MSNTECPICLADTEEMGTVLSCGHKLHLDCKERLQESGRHTCPLCKRPLVPIVEQFERRFEQCRMCNKSMQGVLEEFVTCDCMVRAWRVRMGMNKYAAMLTERP